MAIPSLRKFMHRWAEGVCCCLVVLAACASFGQETGRAVSITAEPDHKIRYDNGKVRVYEIFLSPGRGTLLHEHSADNFTVNFGAAEVTIEPESGDPSTIAVVAGDVGFSSTAPGPYAHRVIATGETDFHGIAVELLSREPARQSMLARRNDPPFSVVLEAPRGRAYRIRLAPGVSTGSFERHGPSVLVAISAGRISEDVHGKAQRLWDFETGQFRWIDGPEELSVRNEGSESVDLVEIEIY